MMKISNLSFGNSIVQCESSQTRRRSKLYKFYFLPLVISAHIAAAFNLSASNPDMSQVMPGERRLSKSSLLSLEDILENWKEKYEEQQKVKNIIIVINKENLKDRAGENYQKLKGKIRDHFGIEVISNKIEKEAQYSDNSCPVMSSITSVNWLHNGSSILQHRKSSFTDTFGYSCSLTLEKEVSKALSANFNVGYPPAGVGLGIGGNLTFNNTEGRTHTTRNTKELTFEIPVAIPAQTSMRNSIELERINYEEDVILNQTFHGNILVFYKKYSLLNRLTLKYINILEIFKDSKYDGYEIDGNCIRALTRGKIQGEKTTHDTNTTFESFYLLDPEHQRHKQIAEELYTKGELEKKRIKEKEKGDIDPSFVKTDAKQSAVFFLPPLDIYNATADELVDELNFLKKNKPDTQQRQEEINKLLKEKVTSGMKFIYPHKFGEQMKDLAHIDVDDLEEDKD